MEQVCEKQSRKRISSGDDESGDKNERVLTFVIVIPFWPICCHETAQSGSTHVPTARPFVDLEQSRMVAKRFRREVFGDCWKRKGRTGVRSGDGRSSIFYLFGWL